MTAMQANPGGDALVVSRHRTPARLVRQVLLLAGAAVALWLLGLLMSQPASASAATSRHPRPASNVITQAPVTDVNGTLQRLTRVRTVQLRGGSQAVTHTVVQAVRDAAGAGRPTLHLSGAAGQLMAPTTATVRGVVHTGMQVARGTSSVVRRATRTVGLPGAEQLIRSVQTGPSITPVTARPRTRLTVTAVSIARPVRSPAERAVVRPRIGAPTAAQPIRTTGDAATHGAGDGAGHLGGHGAARAARVGAAVAQRFPASAAQPAPGHGHYPSGFGVGVGVASPTAASGSAAGGPAAADLPVAVSARRPSTSRTLIDMTTSALSAAIRKPSSSPD